jgi:hypothetical protein
MFQNIHAQPQKWLHSELKFAESSITTVYSHEILFTSNQNDLYRTVGWVYIRNCYAIDPISFGTLLRSIQFYPYIQP